MSASRIARTLAPLVLVLSVALALVVRAPAASAQAVGQAVVPTEDQVFTQLGVDQVPADYVVLIDTSKSMGDGGLYGQVLDTLRPFLAGTTAADRVAVYTFDSVVTLRYTGPGGPTAPILNQVPTAPSDGQTDIGGAISSALDELERSGAAHVGSVVMLTDGVDNPPVGSPYADSRGSAWAALTQRATKLTAGNRSIHGYALPLRGDIDGAALLRQVIPATTVVDPAGVPDIGGFLDRTKRAVRAEKAEQALAGDAGKGVVVEWPQASTVDLSSGQADLPVTLRSELARVPVTVSGLVVDATGVPPGTVAFAAGTPSSVDLRPGQSTTVTVALRWSPGAGPLPYRHTVSARSTLTVRGDVGSPWTAALAPSGVALTVAPAPRDNTHDVGLEAGVGYWWLLPALVALLLLLVLVLRVRAYRRARPRVAGRLHYERVLTPDTGSVALRRGRVEFTFPSSTGDQQGVGSVRPVRDRDGRAALAIEYSPDGSPRRRTADTLRLSGGAVTLSGVEFTLADGSRPTPATLGDRADLPR